MAKQADGSDKSTPSGKLRVEFQAPKSWVLAVDVAAELLGVSRADYIRVACNEKMTRDGHEPPRPGRRRKRKPSQKPSD